MLIRIRMLPDLQFVLAMFIFGGACWAALIGLLFVIDKLRRMYSRSIAYKCMRLEQENKYLKKKMMEERRHV